MDEWKLCLKPSLKLKTVFVPKQKSHRIRSSLRKDQ